MRIWIRERTHLVAQMAFLMAALALLGVFGWRNHIDLQDARWAACVDRLDRLDEFLVTSGRLKNKP